MTSPVGAGRHTPTPPLPEQQRLSSVEERAAQVAADVLVIPTPVRATSIERQRAAPLGALPPPAEGARINLSQEELEDLSAELLGPEMTTPPPEQQLQKRPSPIERNLRSFQSPLPPLNAEQRQALCPGFPEEAADAALRGAGQSYPYAGDRIPGVLSRRGAPEAEAQGPLLTAEERQALCPGFPDLAALEIDGCEGDDEADGDWTVEGPSQPPSPRTLERLAAENEALRAVGEAIHSGPRGSVVGKSRPPSQPDSGDEGDRDE